MKKSVIAICILDMIIMALVIMMMVNYSRDTDSILMEDIIYAHINCSSCGEELIIGDDSSICDRCGRIYKKNN